MSLIACAWTMGYTPPTAAVLIPASLATALVFGAVTFAGTSTRPPRTRALAAATVGLLMAVLAFKVVHAYGGTYGESDLRKGAEPIR